MAIFLTENSKVIVQGMTGSEGRKHTQRMLTSGTNIVGGTNPKKAGQTVAFDGDSGSVDVPVFGSVKEAMEATGANVSIAFVPAPFTKDAVVEAIDAEIPLLVVITEGVPVQDGGAGLAGVDASDDVGARGQHQCGVLGALAAGDALNDDLGVLVEED
jgi:succinyl-CoA synthetase alpha subunit